MVPPNLASRSLRVGSAAAMVGRTGPGCNYLILLLESAGRRGVFDNYSLSFM